MAEDPIAWTMAGPELSITEHPLAFSVLRLHRDDASAAKALGAAFKAPWPTQPNTYEDNGLRVAWLAPGEWAIFAPAAQVQAQVAQACSGRLHHLSDLSAGRRLWRIEGAHSRTLLAKGCSLDTHPKAMSAGRCAQSLLTQVPVLVVAQAADDSFEIVADASFAGHLRSWFTEAAQELL